MSSDRRYVATLVITAVVLALVLGLWSYFDNHHSLVKGVASGLLAVLVWFASQYFLRRRHRPFSAD